MAVNTRVIALRQIGTIAEGTPGFIASVDVVPFLFFSRRVYLCTFSGNDRVAVRPSEIGEFDHGYSPAQIESPDGFSISELLRSAAAHERD